MQPRSTKKLYDYSTVFGLIQQLVIFKKNHPNLSLCLNNNLYDGKV
jgi:hypothetical protein